MSDTEEDKLREFKLDKRRRKKFTNPMSKEREEGGVGGGPLGSGKTPIILVKPDRERERDGERVAEAKSPQKVVPQPTIILKARDVEHRAVSPSQKPPSVLRKEGDSSSMPTATHLMSKSVSSASENVNRLALPPEMKSCVKLIDDSYQMCDNLNDCLTDQTDYLVVGCLGLQGTGKSTIMSLLAGCKLEDLKKSYYFPPQTRDQQEVGAHGTSGIDLWASPSRVIFLDTQPLLSPSIMDRLSQMDKKYTPEFASTENAMEMQSLQLAAFVLSVCHVVLIVQNWFLDPNIVRFIQSAEMLKPTTSQDEEEYFPHVVFVHNLAQPSDFTPDHVKLMQETYLRLFAKSRLGIQSSIGIACGDVVPALTADTCGEHINVFLIPEDLDADTSGRFQGHPGFYPLIQALQKQIFGVQKNPITIAALSEKNWFHYSYRIWESIKKSTFFMEYSRLLP